MSKHDTTADEKLNEHARYLATVLAETASDATTAEELETAAHLWLMGSARHGTATQPTHDADLLVGLTDTDNSDEILRRVRNLCAHSDAVGPDQRTSVQIKWCRPAHQVDVAPAFQRCHAEAGEQPRGDRFQPLARILKWHFAHERSAPGEGGDQDEHRDRWPSPLQIELSLLLLAAEAPEPAKADQMCARGGWLVKTANTRCTADHDAVVFFVPQMTDEQVINAWRLARDRFQQTQEKMRLLESSSLGTARSRSARRRTAPGAVHEVLKRVRSEPDHQ